MKVRCAVALVVVFACGALWLAARGSERLIGSAFLVMSAAALLAWVLRPAFRRTAVVATIVAGMACLSPIDVSLRDVPGPPRVVPFLGGYPSDAARQAEARGDVVLGGCMSSGLEPRWLVVW